MTLDVELPQPVQRTRKPRRRTVVLAVLAAFVLVSVGYFLRYGQCDMRSKFCVVDIVGTRSEIGFEWETPALYVSTWPGG